MTLNEERIPTEAERAVDEFLAAYRSAILDKATDKARQSGDFILRASHVPAAIYPALNEIFVEWWD